MLLQGSALCQPQGDAGEPPDALVGVALGWSLALFLSLGCVAQAEIL